MITLLRHLCSAWSWRMALRDSRASRWRLLLFSGSIVFGVAALVTIGSLRQNLNDSVGNQAKSLLGADLMLGSRQSFTEKQDELFEEIGGEQAREVSFTTMARLGEDSNPRLINIRGLEPQFPFYGTIATDPPRAWESVHEGSGVVVEASLLKSMNAKVGDKAYFGNEALTIMGVLVEAPPTTSGFAAFAPTVLAPLDVIEKSDLLGSKSLAFYRTYFRFDPDFDTGKLIAEKKEKFEVLSLRYMSAKKRRENIEKAINRLYTFLNLVGFSALFLGGIGVAGAIHVHITQRLASVATLRCLGCSMAKSFSVYLAQAIAMGLAGTIMGIVLGIILVLIAAALAAQLPASILPFPIEIAPSILEILKAGLIGFSLCVCFALLPLLAVRRVSPLAALRREDAFQENSKQRSLDPLRLLIIAGLALFAFVLAWWDTHDFDDGWKTALSYIGFLAFSFLFLAGAGKLLRWLARLLIRPSWPFVIRQGFASLYRPNNQTSLFMLSIGLGVFLIFTLLLVQNILLQWLDPQRLENKPNIFLVDVDPEKNEEVEQIMEETGVNPLGRAPIVQLRLTRIKGTPVAELVVNDKKGDKISKRMLRHEFRCTYRDYLTDTEKLTEGEWPVSFKSREPGEAIPVSIEERTGKNQLGLKLGDEVTMSVEGFGEELKLRVASFREVDWKSMDLNFFIVFPTGVLEDFVSFNVISANSPTPTTTALLQRRLFDDFPMVNSIDVSLILRSVQSILKAVGTAVQTMALFTVLTGVIVLIAAILTGRRVRVKESILLRTLGASRQQISRILAVEYAILGLIATIAGASLAVVASQLLGNLVFDGEEFTLELMPIAIASLVIIAGTVIVGMLLSRGVSKHPPLQVLRAEG